MMFQGFVEEIHAPKSARSLQTEEYLRPNRISMMEHF